jgi:hypothetical protein
MDCLLNQTPIACASGDIPKPVVPISSPLLSMIANPYFMIGDWVAFSSQKCDGLTIQVLWIQLPGLSCPITFIG